MGWKELTHTPQPPHRRPNENGTLGRIIPLKVNFFRVQMKNENKALFHYDVDFREYKVKEQKFESVSLPKKKRKSIFDAMKVKHSAVFKNAILGYDCEKNAYSVQSFSKDIEKSGTDGKVFKVAYSDDGTGKTQYQVVMKVVARENLSTLFAALRAPAHQREIPSNVLQMLEILFHQSPTCKFEKVGRNTFYSLGGEFGPSMDIGGGKEAMVGFFESLRPIGWKDDSMLLNIDVAHAAFYREQSVLDFMRSDLGISDFRGPLAEFKLRKLKTELKNMKIQVTHTPFPRTYKVIDVSPLGPDRQTFPMDTPEGPTETSVQNYFLSQYNKRLEFPRLNCLRVGPVKRNIYLPIEVCKIAKGQKVQKKLSDVETAKFIRGTAKMPFDRLNTIRKMVQKQNFSGDPILRALEFTVSDEPVQVNGRILPAPTLRMEKDFMPDKGVWDVRNHTFFESAALEHWAVVDYNRVDEQSLWKFLKMLHNLGQERGMTISKPVLVKSFPNPNPEKDLVEIKKRHPNIQLIMVVLPRFGDYYPRVKKVGDREIKVVTQCVKGDNVFKCAPPTISNIILKINAKRGGTNNVLGQTSRPIVFNEPVMIMGADVNHPPAHDKSTPSLAAVLASMDRYACKYAAEVRHQSHRTEMIQDLKGMTKNLLLSFYRTTKRKPNRIVMYRDGVSESQFLEVLSFELKAMRQACTELGADYKPGITFLVVQKRHHTRLFCNERDGVGRAKNIPPGTTVDNMITHPTERDFYLCSHQGIQGTSRPTHYHVLWDDNDLTMDQLQTMTYAMCHLYSRCTRSVSIPTPAYYAHLVAFRAKVHIRDLCGSETSSVSSGETVISDTIMTPAVKIDLDDEIARKLYFV